VRKKSDAVSAEQKNLDACSIGWSLAHDLDALQKAWIPKLEVRHQLQHPLGEGARVSVVSVHGMPLHQRPNGVHVLHGISNNSLPLSSGRNRICGRNNESVKTQGYEGRQSGTRGAVLALVTCEEGLMTTSPLLQ
jgi:hypothetical protein